MENAVGEYQNIVLLGGRSEIGAAIASRVASPFTKHIVLAGRNMTSVDVVSFEERLAKKGLGSITVSAQHFDAVDASSHTSFFENLGLGSIDLVIVAFGRLGVQDEMRGDPALAAELTAVNMAGVMSSGLACASSMERQGHGHIVFVSSVAGVRVRRSNFIYGATKAGMDAFAQGLGDDLAASGVKVTIVRPGFVRTAMTRGLEPAPLAVDPETVADRVAEGMRKGARVIWAPGILRIVFALFKILPTPIWRRLPIN